MNCVIKSRHYGRKEDKKQGGERVYIVDLVARLIGVVPCADRLGGGVEFCRF